MPYTVLGYHNGPGHRGVARVDPTTDPFPGLSGKPGAGPNDNQYRQEAAIPLGSETHGGEDVALLGAGYGSHRVRGILRNTQIFEIMKAALALQDGQ